MPSIPPQTASPRQEAHLWKGSHCELAVERRAPGVVVVRVSGHDVGEFGTAPMQEVERHLPEGEVIELFIDARSTRAASIDVSGDWAHWLAAHRPRCARIHMLTGSRFIEMTAAFVRRYAELGEVMRIYSDPDAFDALLDAAVAHAHPGADEAP